MMNKHVQEILSWYDSDNPGTLTNLARLLNHGKLAGTGKLVILSVGQGFEHGSARSFGYDPRYHFELAIEAGCNAYAAPLEFLEVGVQEFAGEIPLILKINDHDALHDEQDPNQALTSRLADAQRLGCVGIGFTIYPGSTERLEMYQQIRTYAEEAKRCGLVVMIWAYASSDLSKEAELTIDAISYSAQIAAQLGAHIINVKLPTAHIEQEAVRKVDEKEQISLWTLTGRVRHVVQSTFNGRRIVIFSDGPEEADEVFLNQIRAIRDGNGFGLSIGRNSFQRQKPNALRLLNTIIEIYGRANTSYPASYPASAISGWT